MTAQAPLPTVATVRHEAPVGCRGFSDAAAPFPAPTGADAGHEDYAEALARLLSLARVTVVRG
jgi:hypothetical protein